MVDQSMTKAAGATGATSGAIRDNIDLNGPGMGFGAEVDLSVTDSAIHRAPDVHFAGEYACYLGTCIRRATLHRLR